MTPSAIEVKPTRQAQATPPPPVAAVVAPVARHPRVAIVVNTLLAMLAVVLWASLPLGPGSVTLAVALPLFLALLFLRRERRPLAERATLAIGAFVVCIGVIRAFAPGDALSSGSDSPAPQFLGLLLTLGAALWVSGATSAARGPSSSTPPRHRRRE